MSLKLCLSLDETKAGVLWPGERALAAAYDFRGESRWGKIDGCQMQFT